MADFKTYSLAKICALFDEAMRTIPGYEKYDPTYEPRALIDYEKTKNNYAIKINDCMRHRKGEKNKAKKIETLIKEKTGKTPRKDTAVCSIILTLPRDYEGDTKLFFEAAYKALCITCGIKESDVLYAVVHADESQEHLHYAFLSTAYVRNYDSKKSEWEASVRQARENGTKVPARPTILKGECNRKIEEDEVATGYNCGRFGRGFLKSLNQNLEERMAEMGVECHLANGAGSKFDPQKLNKRQRKESLELFKEIQNQKAELDRKETLLEEKEIELEEMHQKEVLMRKLNEEIKKELKALAKELVMFIPNVVAAFIVGWKEAKSIQEKRKVESQFVKKAHQEAESMYSRFKEYEEKTEMILKDDEFVSGVNLATFNRTPQRIGFAKKQLEKAAERIGQAEMFVSNPSLQDIALSDWFDVEKYRKRLEHMSEVDAKLHMQSTVRAERALEHAMNEFALETLKELEIE